MSIDYAVPGLFTILDDVPAAALEREEDPLRLWAILDESVLHRMIGGPTVMAAQLEHLLRAIERPEIQLQILPAVLPATNGVHPALHGSFTRIRGDRHRAGPRCGGLW